MERDSYKGGRVECFFIGDLNDGTYYLLDVNSLYPFVMRNNRYPVKYVQITNSLTMSDLYKHLSSKAVVAKVLIETDEPIYAVRRERTVFPVGHFWVTLTTPELIYAATKGHIQAVEKAVIYEQESIFKSYVDKFYALRQGFKSAGVEIFEQLCKYMLNSLYGKFGQKGDEWSKIGDCAGEPDREELVFNMNNRRVTKLRYLLGELFLRTGVGECFDSFPAIAAHVTAYARLYLYHLMQEAGHGNYFYCDTDSLIVNEVGLCNLNKRIDKSLLGGLKIDSIGTTVQLRGLKDYSFGAKVVLKGVRKSAIRLSPNIYKQDKWPSFRGLLRSGQPESYVVEKVIKHLSRNYTKGDVTDSGIVTPFVYDDSVVSL